MKGQMKSRRLSIERVHEEISGTRLNVVNRSYFGPVTTNLNRRDRYTKSYFDFCRRVLSGGKIAIFVLEGASISSDEYSYEYQPLLSLAAHSIESELSKLKLEYPKTKFVLSLSHRGPQGSSALSQRALLGPTPYLDVTSGEVCSELSQFEIEGLIDDYGLAARMADEVGFDGVEIAAGQYSIIRAFLSPLTNQRDDEFGRDRGLLLRSVVTKVAQSSRQGLIGVRQSIDELAPWGGFGPDEAADDLIKAESDLPETISYVLCERGSIYSTAETESDYSAGSLYNVEATDRYYNRIVEHLGGNRPVIVDSGGIYSDEDLEAIFSRSRKIEVIDLTRPIIADPFFLDADYSPRSCIACNQGCLVGDSRNFPISCAVNADISPEIEAPKRIGGETISRAKNRHDGPRVAVVGGGVAGITAALRLSEAKYSVVLFEAGASIGGQLGRFADTHPNHRLAKLLSELKAEVNDSTIRLELETAISGYDDLFDFEQVVVATGARFLPRTTTVTPRIIDGRDSLDHLASGHIDPIQLFDPQIASAIKKESRIVFYDVVGDETSRAIVKRLIDLDLRFTYVSPDPVAFSQLALSNGLVEGNTTLIRSGAELIFEAKVTALEDHSCVVEEIYSQHQRVIDFDYFVEANRYFAHDHAFRGGRGTLIGDALAPRSIRSAVAEGSRLIEVSQTPSRIHTVGARP